MHGRGKKAVLATVLGLVLGCGSAAEMDSFQSDSAEADSGTPTILGHFTFMADPASGEISVTPIKAASDISETLFMNRDAAGMLGTAIAMSDVSINWFTPEYDENNVLRVLSGSTQNTNSSSLHYNNFVATFSLFKPSSVTMPAPASSDGMGGYTIDFQSIPYNVTNTRSMVFSNPAGAAFYTAVTLAANTTSTAPTAYITNSTTTFFPQTVISTDINGLGFGTSPTFTIGGNTVTYSSAIDTRVRFNTNLNTSTGFVVVTNGSAIQGPYVFRTTQGTVSLRLPASSGSVQSTLFTKIWTSAATIDGNGCPPTSGFGTYGGYITNQLTLSDSITLTNANVAKFINISGAAKAYVAFDLNRNRILDAGDPYVYNSSVTITANSLNSLGAAAPFTTIISATCP